MLGSLAAVVVVWPPTVVVVVVVWQLTAAVWRWIVVAVVARQLRQSGDRTDAVATVSLSARLAECLAGWRCW